MLHYAQLMSRGKQAKQQKNGRSSIQPKVRGGY
nr:MAG TPA: hypothetical protein [Bacteriophage sp.]